MSNSSGSYRQIFKATSIFGGVQFITILVSIVRSKAIAILLGPSGMGIVSMFTTTISLITGLTSFGIGTSAVKNVASAVASNDQLEIAKTVGVLRRLVWATGGLGFVVTLVLAPWLSEIAFGNKTYAVAFAFLSITLLFAQITVGQSVLLRGMRKIQYMAKASLFGSLVGLIVSLPLYYFFAEDGIVPSIILTSIVTLFFSWFYARKVKIPDYLIDRVFFLKEGKDMLQMGFLISISSLVAILVSYLVRIYINSTGSITDVGLYSAGFAIINTYVGMVFTAMSTDYFPRLAAVSTNDIKSRQEINHQAEIALIILSPLLILFLVFVKWGVILLYSKEFLDIVDMVKWAALGVFFKACSWAITILFLAKGAKKIYFWNEVIANIYILAFNVVGYMFWGLTGLGISFLVSYFIYFIQVFLIAKVNYKFALSSGLCRIFLLQFSLAFLCFILTFYSFIPYVEYFKFILLLVSVIIAALDLHRRIDLKTIFRKLGI